MNAGTPINIFIKAVNLCAIKWLVPVDLLLKVITRYVSIKIKIVDSNDNTNVIIAKKSTLLNPKP